MALRLVSLGSWNDLFFLLRVSGGWVVVFSAAPQYRLADSHANYSLIHVSYFLFPLSFLPYFLFLSFFSYFIFLSFMSYFLSCRFLFHFLLCWSLFYFLFFPSNSNGIVWESPISLEWTALLGIEAHHISIVAGCYSHFCWNFRTLEIILKHSSPTKMALSLLDHGAQHRNASVRRTSSHFVYRCLEKIGPENALENRQLTEKVSGKRDFTQTSHQTNSTKLVVLMY